MSERIQRQRTSSVAGQEETDEQLTVSQSSVDLDALLDNIDATLETDVEEYVRNFVQKGGQ